MKKTQNKDQPNLLEIPKQWVVLESFSSHPLHRTRFEVIQRGFEQKTIRSRKNKYRFQLLPEVFDSEKKALEYAQIRLQLLMLENPEKYQPVPYPRVMQDYAGLWLFCRYGPS